MVPELYCSYVGRCTPCIGCGVERCSRQGTKASIIIHVDTVYSPGEFLFLSALVVPTIILTTSYLLS